MLGVFFTGLSNPPVVTPGRPFSGLGPGHCAHRSTGNALNSAGECAGPGQLCVPPGVGHDDRRTGDALDQGRERTAPHHRFLGASKHLATALERATIIRLVQVMSALGTYFSTIFARQLWNVSFDYELLCVFIQYQLAKIEDIRWRRNAQCQGFNHHACRRCAWALLG